MALKKKKKQVSVDCPFLIVSSLKFIIYTYFPFYSHVYILFTMFYHVVVFVNGATTSKTLKRDPRFVKMNKGSDGKYYPFI
jgi:preprotein translocase subunit SecY